MQITEFEENAQVIWVCKTHPNANVPLDQKLNVGKITKVEKSKRNIWVTGETQEDPVNHVIKPSWILAIEDIKSGIPVDFGEIVGIAKLTPQGHKYLKIRKDLTEKK